MTDFLDFLPLAQETIEAIRARLDADANAGVAPSERGYMDMTEGGFGFDLTQPPALEAERLWDFLATEVVSAMFVQSAWGPYLDEHGEMLGVPRKDAVKATGEVTFTGINGTFIGTGTQVAQPATEPDADPVEFLTIEDGVIAGGSLTLAVEAAEEGHVGNVAAAQITFPITAINGLTSITNAAATSGGAEVESDERYQERLLLEWRSPGAAGNKASYERWALAWPGVGYVTVYPATDAAGNPDPNHVRVVIADVDRNPSSATVVNELKAFLDPGDGTGEGEAPIGATVHVQTVVAQAVPVVAEVHFESGYSLDGTGGTVPIGDAIKAVVLEYINGLAPGEDVILAKVESLFFRVTGVADVRNVTLNGVAANFAISAQQVATVTTGQITLTAF